ncbi:methyl-accepting chemotaxis protein [Usitatibacter palustris]|uniref:Methyl-accepting chemotaxis protein n=1 Tax=Usitatibacter palustris TaxID=2732487 RepID=A0A6M4H6A4_9PROT|nr:methyl-accepting chemotaxis protein [Usitatibacter palustris]QJR15040.1 hypothetical protein DSM104440_01856 [Usitatibacter palustris]
MKIKSLQTKMVLIAAVGFTVSLLVSMGGLMRVYGTAQDLDRISREDSENTLAVLRAGMLFKEQVQEWKNVLLRGKNTEQMESHWAIFLDKEKQVQGEVRAALSGASIAEVRAPLERFIEAHKTVGEAYRKAFEVFKSSGRDAAAGDQAVASVDRAPMAMLDQAVKAEGDAGTKAIAAAVKSAERSYWIAIIAMIVTSIVALVCVWLYMRAAVVRPMASSVVAAERIAQGDLTTELHATTDDEAGQLLRALSRMTAGLAQVVSAVRTSAESVVTASNQVAAGTTDLSQRTEEQASSLEETAASMEELASTVKQNADNAKRADELAHTASKRAEKGGSEVVRVVMTMNEISESAGKISDIISVIDGIAFQTNILALNAAVEAARAGEQGRGFAVVASEVRALAQRSAQAAKEIKGLIGASLAKVDAGTKLVEDAGDTIQSLVIDVQQVSDLMRQIAEASAEQSRGVQQVNKTVTEMDKVVQQNASAVQESASAAESMRQQAGSLVRAVSVFQIARGTASTLDFDVLEAPSAFSQASALPSGSGGKVPTVGKEPARSMPVARSSDDDWEQF